MKKWIIMMLSVICLALCAVAFAACAPKNEPRHTWAPEWRHTIDRHWHYCLDAGCTGTSQNEEHNLYVYEIYEGRQPTCGKTGRGVWKCADCGVTIEDAIPAGFAFEGGVLIDGVPAAIEHNWELESEAPRATCNTAGREIWVCKNDDCGEIQTVEVPATGEHRYIEGLWTSSKAGHQQACADCGTLSEVLPHVPGAQQKTNPVGMNDGKIDIYCTECDCLISSTPIPSDEAPKTLEIQISGVSITALAPDANGNLRGAVTLSTGVPYSITYSARNNLGNSMSGITEAITSNQNGIRVYYSDGVDGHITRLGMMASPADQSDPNYQKVNYMSNSSPVSNSLTINATGGHVIVFQFETGDKDANNGTWKVRTTYTLFVNYDQAALVSAQSSDLAPVIADDKFTCLATGAYKEN